MRTVFLSEVPEKFFFLEFGKLNDKYSVTVGCFKDETYGIPIIKFDALKQKMYILLLVNSYFTKIALEILKIKNNKMSKVYLVQFLQN